MVKMDSSTHTFSWKGAKLIPSLILLTIAAILWFVPAPKGLTVTAWHLLVIFVTTIVSVIAKPLPISAIAIISITFCAATGTLPIESCLKAYGSDIVWLIILAFFLAQGFVKTGLGTRVSYFFISILGRNTIGLAYGCILTELFLAPFIPSNTARGGGITFPIATSLAKEMGTNLDERASHRLGGYLINVCFHLNMITSAMFMTGLVGNPLIASLAADAGVTITWGIWATAAVIPGLVNLAILPIVMYKLYPPEVKKAPEAVQIARKKLKNMGSLRVDEWIMVGTLALILTLWMMSKHFGVNATTVALIGFSILLFTGVLHWKDAIREHNAWDTMIWFAAFLMMASELTKLGTMKWLSTIIQGCVVGLQWPVALLILGLVYFYVHYLFASVTAHITALYGAFLMVLIALGTPPMLAALALAVGTSLSGSLTHFGTGTAPIYYSANYVTLKDWWRVAFWMSVVNIIIWVIIGGAWWKLLGYW